MLTLGEFDFIVCGTEIVAGGVSYLSPPPWFLKTPLGVSFLLMASATLAFGSLRSR